MRENIIMLVFNGKYQYYECLFDMPINSIEDGYTNENELRWYALEMIENDKRLKRELKGCYINVTDTITENNTVICKTECNIER